MSEMAPVVSGKGGANPQEAQAWARISRTLSAAVAVVLGLGLYVDGGYAPAAAFGIAVTLAIIAGIFGAMRHHI